DRPDPVCAGLGATTFLGILDVGRQRVAPATKIARGQVPNVLAPQRIAVPFSLPSRSRLGGRFSARHEGRFSRNAITVKSGGCGTFPWSILDAGHWSTLDAGLHNRPYGLPVPRWDRSPPQSTPNHSDTCRAAR